MGPDDVLLFVHIPKTGGVTLTSLLASRFRPEEILPIAEKTDHRKMLRELAPEELAKVRFVAGHFWFGPGDRGVHDLLTQHPVRISMLREPVARTLSVYRHIAGRPGRRLHPLKLIEGLSHYDPGDGTLYPAWWDMSFLEFLRHPMGQAHTRNVQARQIVGTHPRNPRGPAALQADRLSDEELLELAKARLEDFAFVGLLERFEESVSILMGTFGWEPVASVPRLNQSPAQREDDEITSEEREEILRLTEVDTALYRHAEGLFEARASSHA